MSLLHSVEAIRANVILALLFVILPKQLGDGLRNIISELFRVEGTLEHLFHTHDDIIDIPIPTLEGVLLVGFQLGEDGQIGLDFFEVFSYIGTPFRTNPFPHSLILEVGERLKDPGIVHAFLGLQTPQGIDLFWGIIENLL